MKMEIIERRGKQFAVVPLKEFDRLRHDAEMLHDIRAYDAAKARNEEAFPAEVAARLIGGENPIRTFRKHRAFTQEQLARAAQIARPYLAELEAGRKHASVKVLKAIAEALDVELDDLVV